VMEKKGVVSSSSSNCAEEESLTVDEAEIYDRQIRLWGLEAQNRLRNSSVLVAGLSGLGAEVTKNLMLAGLKSLTLLDHNPTSEEDRFSQFLCDSTKPCENRAEGSRRRAEDLNPNVRVVVDTESLSEKMDPFFRQFNLVVLIDQNEQLINKIDQICRKNNIKFIAGGVYGWFGYGFFDFQRHSFLDKTKRESADNDVQFLDGSEEPALKKKKLEDETVVDDGEDLAKKIVEFPSWEEAMNVNWKNKANIRKARRILPPAYCILRALISHDLASSNDDAFKKAWMQGMESCGMDPAEQWEYFDKCRRFVSGQLSPVCAIVGGMLAQEGITALSQTDRPLDNLFIYSAVDTTGVICKMPPS